MHLSRTLSLAKSIRAHAVRMSLKGGSSHLSSALSIADILGVLYGEILRYRSMEPKWECRDRFVLSKGHAGTALYAALAEVGFFPTEKLDTHYQNGSDLSGHISHKNIPGVELSTGSLGHGLPFSVGMAYAALQENKTHRVFCLLSDGECDEGSNWEAILFASHHKLKNLVAIVDYNKIQSLGLVADTLALEPFAEKWRAFGWKVEEVNGHDHAVLSRALGTPSADKPLCILAHTTKGKGISFTEKDPVAWHYRAMTPELYDKAIEELQRS